MRVGGVGEEMYSGLGPGHHARKEFCKNKNCCIIP